MNPSDDLIEAPPMALTVREAVREAENYWTPERIESAQPLPLRTRPKSATIFGGRPGALSMPSGSLVEVPPIWPKPLQSPTPLRPAETRRVDDLTAYPFAVVGKLRMSFPRGGGFVGSAWVIGRRAILTAGHCLYDARAGGCAAHVQFLPQYRQGVSLGVWTITRQTALREFVQKDDLRYDLAAAILDRDLGHLTGIAGYRVNPIMPQGTELIGLGYPARPQDRFPFDGEHLWQSQGRLVSDPAPGTTRERTLGATNDLSGGSSGGPWFAADSPGVALGLNSHIHTDNAGNPIDWPRQMRSPYFGAAFMRLVKWLQDNGGEPNEPGQHLDSGTPPAPIPPPPDTLKTELLKIAEQLGKLANKL